jgi:hypothetical protein
MPVIEESLHKVFRDIGRMCPHSPIYIITALAEGADRIAAKVALDLGMRIIAPLPMRRELYEKDFSSPESMVEFEELLSESEEWFELPLLDGAEEKDIIEYSDARDHQYAFVGAYIARYSHVVIALWDGDPQEKVGGTSYVVSFKLRGITPPYVAIQGRFEPEEVGSVYQIVTPRIHGNTPSEPAGTIIIHHPKETSSSVTAEKRFKSLLEDTEGFNSNEVELLPLLVKQQAQSKSYLSPELPNTLSGVRTANLSNYFSVSDVLAGYFQKKTHTFFKYFFGSAMLATALFEFYAYILTDNPEVLGVFFLNLLVAYLLYTFVAKQKFQDKFQDYRAIAEGLRIQYYWKLAGIEESVANNYLKEQRSELDWIRQGLRSWSLPFFQKGNDLTNLDQDMESARWKLIIDGWINDQYKYFAKSSGREVKRLQKLTRAANFLLIGGFSLIGVNMAYHWFIGHTSLAWVLYIASIFPIGAGLLFGYAEKLSLSEHARQYEKMTALFANAKHQLEQCLEKGSFTDAREVVYELGKEALKENGDWVLTHRNRPIEVPLA